MLRRRLQSVLCLCLVTAGTCIIQENNNNILYADENTEIALTEICLQDAVDSVHWCGVLYVEYWQITGVIDRVM